MDAIVSQTLHLSSFSIDELVTIAKYHGIKLSVNPTQQELITAIINKQNGQPVPLSSSSSSSVPSSSSSSVPSSSSSAPPGGCSIPYSLRS